MSSMDDEDIIASWVGPKCLGNFLSVAVLSSSAHVIEKIAEKLLEAYARGSYRWKLHVLRSYDLSEIVLQSNLTGRMAIDFVMLCIDTSRPFCLKWAEKTLRQVHPDLMFRRVVLVNATGLPMNAMAVSASEIIAFQTKNKLDMLNANVFRDDEAKILARKLLKYMEVSIGVFTGIPNLNI